MKRLHMFIITASLLAAGCSGAGETADVTWKPAPACAKSVTVFCGSTIVEKYAFTYDSDGRMTSLTRTDVLSSKPLVDVKYAYEGTKVLVSGIFSQDSKQKTVEVNGVKGGLDYTAPQAWTYHVSLSGGLPSSSGVSGKFNSSAGVLSTEYKFEETYKSQAGDIVEHTAGTVTRGDTGKATRVAAAEALTYHYTYASSEDRQNFGAFLMECEFPVWYAAGLPGCRHLISDVKVSGDGIDYHGDQHVDYKFDADGNITSAVRAWKSGDSAYLTLRYEFEY